MKFNYGKLEGRIAEKFGTQNRFARSMHMTPRTLSLKLNSKAMFRQDEILLACCLLRIAVEQIPFYFFAQTEEDFIG